MLRRYQVILSVKPISSLRAYRSLCLALYITTSDKPYSIGASEFYGQSLSNLSLNAITIFMN
jgi:hypothetical protein